MSINFIDQTARLITKVRCGKTDLPLMKRLQSSLSKKWIWFMCYTEHPTNLLIYLVTDFKLIITHLPSLGRMDPLRNKLESQGLKNVVYMVVNHQGEHAQRLHPMLADRLSENITLYKQDELQPDVWKSLNAQKDDFLIYDRCVTCNGQFTFSF